MAHRSSLLSRKPATAEPPTQHRHPLEGPAATLTQRYFPLGFPVDVFTNSPVVLQMYDRMWRHFTARFEEQPIRCEVVVSATDAIHCPPEPRYHLQLPLFTTICDGDNFSIADLEKSSVSTHITQEALRYPLFTEYFLLSTAYSCISTLHATPIHSACVSWKNRGFLLCGDSGAGKSSMAYFCARNGWSYTSDDASYLMHNDSTARQVTGNCHAFRMRPASAELFPEIGELKMAARAAGKPSVVVETSALSDVITSPTAHVEFIVFLNRKDYDGTPAILPASRDVARQSMLASLYGVPRTLALQYQAIDHLLEMPVYELRYSTLEDGLRLLQSIADDSFVGRSVPNAY